MFPGLDEVFSLSDIKTYADSGEWDVIVVDCAPTAETIRFLSLPDILSWYMTRVFPASRRLNKVVSPLLSKVTNLPVAGDEVFGSARRFYDRLDGVRELLTDTAAHERPARGQPRAHGHRRGPPHRDLPRAVRLRRRRGHRQPAAARHDHRPVVPAVEGAAGAAPHHDRGGLRPAADPAGRARTGRARRARPAAVLRHRPVPRPRRHRGPAPRVAARGAQAGRHRRADHRPPLRRSRRPRARTPPRRAARPRRCVPPVVAAARLAPQADGHRRVAAGRTAAGDVRVARSPRLRRPTVGAAGRGDRRDEHRRVRRGRRVAGRRRSDDAVDARHRGAPGGGDRGDRRGPCRARRGRGAGGRPAHGGGGRRTCSGRWRAVGPRPRRDDDGGEDGVQRIPVS